MLTTAKTGVTAAALVLAAPFGVAAIMLLPVYARADRLLLKQALFPRLGSAIEELTSTQIGLFLVLGVVLGYFAGPIPLTRWFFFAPVTAALSVAWLPLAALVEMRLYPGTHNLWPLEFLFYGFYGCLVLGGLALGRALTWLSPLRGAA